MRPDQVVVGLCGCLSPSAGRLALKPIAASATAGNRDLSQNIPHTHSRASWTLKTCTSQVYTLDPASHMLRGVYLTGMYLSNVYLIGVHLIGLYLIGIYLSDVHLTGAYLIDVHLIGVHLMGVHFIGVPVCKAHAYEVHAYV
jgi:hypothetical protein